MTEINPSKGSQSDFQAQFKNQLEESEPAPFSGSMDFKSLQKVCKQTIEQHQPNMSEDQVNKIAESIAKTIQEASFHM
jgi:hypothetical protein